MRDCLPAGAERCREGAVHRGTAGYLAGEAAEGRPRAGQREGPPDRTLRKQILWESDTATESELALKEVEMIKQYRSNDHKVGYNRWPKFIPDSE